MSSGRNWTKVHQQRLIARQGSEDRKGDPTSIPLGGRPAPFASKEQLRRMADELLKTHPVAKAAPVKPAKFGSRKNPKRSEIIDRSVPSGLVIYADGCCEPNPGAGGWGFVVYRDGVEIFSDSSGSLATTNQRMEQTSALSALRWAEEHRIASETFRIFSDSQYVVKGCNQWRTHWKGRDWRRGTDQSSPKDQEIANLDLWKALDVVLIRMPVTFEWCKGHAGIVGNERADELSLIGRNAAMIEQQLATEAFWRTEA